MEPNVDTTVSPPTENPIAGVVDPETTIGEPERISMDIPMQMDIESLFRSEEEGSEEQSEELTRKVDAIVAAVDEDLDNESGEKEIGVLFARVLGRNSVMKSKKECFRLFVGLTRQDLKTTILKRCKPEVIEKMHWTMGLHKYARDIILKF